MISGPREEARDVVQHPTMPRTAYYNKGLSCCKCNNFSLFISLCHHHHHNACYLLHSKHFVSAPIVNVDAKYTWILLMILVKNCSKYYVDSWINFLTFFANLTRILCIFIFIESISKFIAIGFSFLWMFFPMYSRILPSGNREISYLLEDISWVLYKYGYF